MACRHATIGFYWPFRGEIDLVGFVRGLIGTNSVTALPVVVEKGRPLEFWRWEPGMEMLGYGGGYYDRKIVALPRPPLAIGIGYRFQRMPTIQPQPFDQPMDASGAASSALTSSRLR